MKCPNCGLDKRYYAKICDCGFDFESEELESLNKKEDITQGIPKEKVVHEPTTPEISFYRKETRELDRKRKRDLREYKTSFIRDPAFLIYFLSGVAGSLAAVSIFSKGHGVFGGVVFSCIAVACFLMSIQFARGGS